MTINTIAMQTVKAHGGDLTKETLFADGLPQAVVSTGLGMLAVALTSVFMGLAMIGPLGLGHTAPIIGPVLSLRLPSFSLGGAIRCIDYVGTALFAHSGCTIAGNRGLNLMGCVIVACITAMGGGTFASFCFGATPVFWVKEPEYLAISVTAALASFVLWPQVPQAIKDSKGMEEALNWLDGFCLGVFTVVGADSALRRGNGPLLAVLCGVMTATFGGFTRDVVCAQPVRILHSHAECYASCCLCGAALYTVLISMPALPVLTQVGVPVLLVTLFRKMAWTRGLRLPVYAKSYSGRSVET